jgi:hypothetical protein
VQFSKPRFIRQDVELGGVRLKRGDQIVGMLVAANMDPAANMLPEKLDLERRPYCFRHRDPFLPASEGGRRSPGARPSRSHWPSFRLDLVAQPKPQNWTAIDLPNAARSLPRASYGLGPGFCCVCGRLGWHTDLWSAGPNKNAAWHCACVIAWEFWNAPNTEASLLRRLQGRRCGQRAGRLWKDAEVDHRIPLFLVWRDHRNEG